VVLSQETKRAEFRGQFLTFKADPRAAI
jgi:hypothetical protein